METNIKMVPNPGWQYEFQVLDPPERKTERLKRLRCYTLIPGTFNLTTDSEMVAKAYRRTSARLRKENPKFASLFWELR